MSENVTASPSSRDLVRTYARLGLTSFGGPVAHIGYYRRAFIEQTGWMDDDAFAERCRVLYESGARYLDEKLFNGEYYEHEIRAPATTLSRLYWVHRR